MDPLRRAIKALLEQAFRGFDSMFISVVDVLTLTGTASSPILDIVHARSLVEQIAEVIRGFCLPIAGLCILIELAQVASKVDLLKWEHGLKVCVKMALTVVIIYNVDTFLWACYYLAAQWVGDVASIRGIPMTPDPNFIGPPAPIAPISKLGELACTDLELLVTSVSGTWEVLGLFMSVLVLVLAITACGIIVQVIVYFRMFELLVYVAISPLPCAFFPLGNGEGGGFSRITAKFLRGFAAVCLQGVMIIICLSVFDAVVGSALSKSITEIFSATTNPANVREIITRVAGAITIQIPDPNGRLKSDIATLLVSELCFTMLLGSVVLIMSVMKCGSWAKSILDAV